MKTVRQYVRRIEVWLYTAAGQKWFPWFRLYGPEKAVFDKTFKLPDIEKAS